MTPSERAAIRTRLAVRAYAVGGILQLLVLTVHSGQQRTPFAGTASLGGRSVERLVLLRTIHVNRPLLTRGMNGEYWILPGQFMPVSEDPSGVYFQATNGLKVFSGYREPQPVDGGLYVSKARPDVIYRYFGNARDPRAALDVESMPLSSDLVRQLKVAHAGGK